MSLHDFVAYAERIAAGPYFYAQNAGRCDPERSGYADCSGLIVAAYRHVGVNLICTGSFQQARWCHQYGISLTYEQARRTRGALCFIGINEGQGGVPGRDPGHVAISRGDGTTVEAANRNAGILIRPFDGRGWNYFGLPPWIPPTVQPAQPAPADKPAEAPNLWEEDMLFVSPSPGKDRFSPKSAKVIGGALFVFNTKTSPFHKGDGKAFPVRDFGNGRIVDLGLVAGETVLSLTDYDHDGPLNSTVRNSSQKDRDHLVAWTLQKNGKVYRHDLYWIV